MRISAGVSRVQLPAAREVGWDSDAPLVWCDGDVAFAVAFSRERRYASRVADEDRQHGS